MLWFRDWTQIQLKIIAKTRGSYQTTPFAIVKSLIIWQFKKKFFTKKSAIIIICTVVILGAFGIGYQKVEKKAAKYQKTIDELKTDVKNIEQTNKTFEKENKGIDTDEFKERIARERLGMIKEGEISLQEAKEGEEASTGISSEDTSEESSKESSGENSKEETQTTESAGSETDTP